MKQTRLGYRSADWAPAEQHVSPCWAPGGGSAVPGCSM